MKKGDIIIALVVIILVGGFFLYTNKLNSRIEGDAFVEIKIDNDVIEYIKLEEGKTQEIKIDNEYGYNLIKIDGMSVQILEADCPDLDCVEIGKIFANKRGFKVIVCAPNHLSVKIVDETDDGSDSISN